MRASVGFPSCLPGIKILSQECEQHPEGCLVIVIDYCTGMEEMEDNGGIRNKKE